MLISVHLPKTAGTTFSQALESHFGRSFRRDYGDVPLNTPPATRHRMARHSRLTHLRYALGSVRCIHGHFLPWKYSLLAKVCRTRFVVWFREPLARLASHYHFWQRSYDPETTQAPLHRRVVEEAWSLERFCLGPELRNVYQQFLWRFPLEKFSFVGCTERFDQDLPWFCEMFLGEPNPWEAHNVNPQRTEEFGDAGFRRKVETYHEADVQLYRRALERRAEILARFRRGSCVRSHPSRA